MGLAIVRHSTQITPPAGVIKSFRGTIVFTGWPVSPGMDIGIETYSGVSGGNTYEEWYID